MGTTTFQPEDDDFIEATTLAPSRLSFADLFSEDPEVKPDGRKPRVKSNIKQRLANNGKNKKHKIPVPSDLFEPKNHGERSIDNSQLLENLIEDDQVKTTSEKPTENNLTIEQAIQINQSSDLEPVVRPDGQKPRVKSNILAANNHNKKQENKKENNFRHSKKVESAKFFQPTTLPPEEPSSTQPDATPIQTSTPSASLLDVFLSTQVLNTRAVDPTLASLHEKVKEELQNQSQRKRRKRK